MSLRYYYLLRIQYLGYRLHGWQKQPKLKTVEGLLVKTLKFVLPEERFKILGAGRTDAKVSAQAAAFELFLEERPLEDPSAFLALFNANLPPDIRALSIEQVDAKFNIIQDATSKEYLYFFAFGEKSHPFCASLLSTFPGDLDIELMKKAASMFQGFYNFRNYCSKPTTHTILEREVEVCEIVENDIMSASFFPEQTFLLRIRSKGFLRNQIRLIMGALVQLGRGEIELDDLKESLDPEKDFLVTYIAPGSGLILNEIDFKGA